MSSLVHSFESSGRFADTVSGGNSGGLDVPQGWNPSPTAQAAGRSPANPMFGGLLGLVVDKVVQAFQDGLFMGAGQGMLGTCDGCRNQQGVSKALGDADLSKLNPQERSQILQQIGFASLDGHISKIESNAIIDTLNRAQGIKPPQNGDWQVKQDGGKAQIDLGKYTLDLNEGNSEFTLTNKETGEQTRAWGDPHFQTTDENGNLKAVGDFYGTTTLNLDDGTKITIHTTPWAAGGNGATLATELVITQGDRAMVVQGLDQNQLGDLRIGQVANGGRLVDAVNQDGANLYENPEGTGWLRMNEGGFLTEVDGAFLSTIRDDRSASDSDTLPRQSGNTGGGFAVTPFANPIHLFANLGGGGDDARPADGHRPTIGPVNHEPPRANPNAAGGGRDASYYRNNPDYELRADGSYALKYKPLEHGNIFVLGMRMLDDGTKVWE